MKLSKPSSPSKMKKLTKKSKCIMTSSETTQDYRQQSIEWTGVKLKCLQELAKFHNAAELRLPFSSQ